MMSKEISDEIKKQAKAAYNNDTDYYCCVATGKTFPVKEELQSNGFHWETDKKAWVAEDVSAWEKFLFERYVIDCKWPDVRLVFTKEKSIMELNEE